MTKNRNGIMRWLILSLSSLMLVGAPLLTLTGCSHNPTQQVNDYSQEIADITNADAAVNDGYNPDDPQMLSLFGGLLELNSGHDEVLIGSNGGQLNVSLGGEDIVFNVPAGALESPVEISISGVRTAILNGEIYIYNCQPSGIHFKKPITVSHPVGRGLLKSLFFYKADDSRVWELLQVLDVRNGSVDVEIHHFSGYGISNYRR